MVVVRGGGVVWNGEKETQKRGGGVFSVRCLPGLNESTCFLFLFPGVGVGGRLGDGRQRRAEGIISRKFGQTVNWSDPQDFYRISV